uniref:hypothetical protein n=1 Tax=Parendozoicomonas sp. Alg238-R29 TaxID=2993446 RepID=UPI00248F0F37
SEHATVWIAQPLLKSDELLETHFEKMADLSPDDTISVLGEDITLDDFLGQVTGEIIKGVKKLHDLNQGFISRDEEAGYEKIIEGFLDAKYPNYALDRYEESGELVLKYFDLFPAHLLMFGRHPTDSNGHTQYEVFDRYFHRSEGIDSLVRKGMVGGYKEKYAGYSQPATMLQKLAASALDLLYQKISFTEACGMIGNKEGNRYRLLNTVIEKINKSACFNGFRAQVTIEEAIQYWQRRVEKNMLLRLALDFLSIAGLLTQKEDQETELVMSETSDEKKLKAWARELYNGELSHLTSEAEEGYLTPDELLSYLRGMVSRYISGTHRSGEPVQPKYQYSEGAPLFSLSRPLKHPEMSKYALGQIGESAKSELDNIVKAVRGDSLTTEQRLSEFYKAAREEARARGNDMRTLAEAESSLSVVQQPQNSEVGGSGDVSGTTRPRTLLSSPSQLKGGPVPSSLKTVVKAPAYGGEEKSATCQLPQNPIIVDYRTDQPLKILQDEIYKVRNDPGHQEKPHGALLTLRLTRADNVTVFPPLSRDDSQPSQPLHIASLAGRVLFEQRAPLMMDDPTWRSCSLRNAIQPLVPALRKKAEFTSQTRELEEKKTNTREPEQWQNTIPWDSIDSPKRMPNADVHTQGIWHSWKLLAAIEESLEQTPLNNEKIDLAQEEQLLQALVLVFDLDVFIKQEDSKEIHLLQAYRMWSGYWGAFYKNLSLPEAERHRSEARADWLDLKLSRKGRKGWELVEASPSLQAINRLPARASQPFDFSLLPKVPKRPTAISRENLAPFPFILSPPYTTTFEAELPSSFTQTVSSPWGNIPFPIRRQDSYSKPL